VPDSIVESVESVVYKCYSIGISNIDFTGNDNFSLNARESLGDNSNYHRLLIFVHNNYI
jgi:hypothetical protein